MVAWSQAHYARSAIDLVTGKTHGWPIQKFRHVKIRIKELTIGHVQIPPDQQAKVPQNILHSPEKVGLINIVLSYRFCHPCNFVDFYENSFCLNLKIFNVKYIIVYIFKKKFHKETI